MKEEYENQIAFIKELARLKDVSRTAWTREGRQESVAEHSWRLAVFAMVLEEQLEGVDSNKVIRMCLIHDLGEAYEGDVSATVQVDPGEKLKTEETAVLTLLAPLPERMREKFLDLWWEYNRGETREARIAKAIDKMETILQHNQGKNPPDFDFAFNLEYGRAYSLLDPVMKSLREIIDAETRSKLRQDKE